MSLPSQDVSRSKEAEFEFLLADLFRRAGWEVLRQPQLRGTDLIIDSGDRRYVIEFETVLGRSTRSIDPTALPGHIAGTGGEAAVGKIRGSGGGRCCQPRSRFSRRTTEGLRKAARTGCCRWSYRFGRVACLSRLRPGTVQCRTGSAFLPRIASAEPPARASLLRPQSMDVEGSPGAEDFRVLAFGSSRAIPKRRPLGSRCRRFGDERLACCPAAVERGIPGRSERALAFGAGRRTAGAMACLQPEERA